MYQVQQQGPPMPPQATPRTVASLRINSPWRRGNDNSWNPSLDTNNNMHSLDQPSTIANPAFYSHFGTFQRPAQQANEVTLEGVPIKGAASTDFTKGTLPKNFAQPLTCFYWHTYGRCTKSSDECLSVYTFTCLLTTTCLIILLVTLTTRRESWPQLRSLSRVAKVGPFTTSTPLLLYSMVYT